ncbi:helix-turn-helix transcriptional regulator [Hyphobacterium marinum]|uniref:HTH domain-containing protein n=1 Tax=Hyphobacterium marinum TaxID=3116574 RepID=A0ABU7LV07_9PROT|nr:HTH domain-containing protein [Hyphobacterium sp. Y6023]MEE2565401.1 HTH domain-containing protein [Hyphobacterium sp. Y6023]
MSRSRRLVELVRALKEAESGVVTARALAERFDVSERTIYRDMATLIESGVPIEGEAGSGYQLAVGGGPPPLTLSWPEAEAAWLGTTLLTYLAKDDREAAAHRVKARLSKVLGDDRVARLDRILETLETGESPNPTPLLNAWNRARERGETVKVRYGRTRETATEYAGRPGQTLRLGPALVLFLETADGMMALRGDRIVKLVVHAP